MARRNDLVYSAALETWMDTGAGYDEREGYCIEIQALWAAQLSALIRVSQKLQYLTGDYIASLRGCIEQVQAHFVNPDTLRIADCVKKTASGLQRDETCRPNVLIAYYIYPGLFPLNVWQKNAKFCIDELWCEWGGLATISKQHPLYKDTYTGQTNKSYHRGDVWYFVNGIGAIVLRQLGFVSQSKQLMLALHDEILSYGALGCASEVSDAHTHNSHGCDLQLWSNAIYIEALHELHDVLSDLG